MATVHGMRWTKAALMAAVGSCFVGVALAQDADKAKKADPAPAEAKAPEGKAAEFNKVLKVGDAAPALRVEKWLKGSPVTSFEKGKIYVLEAWATWCGPCIQAMPHLSELQHQYKDKGVTIIGVNIWEDARGETYTPETLSNVEKFVTSQGERMDYAVAYDGPAKGMDHAYMAPAQQQGIPCSFVIDGKGNIAFIGNPQALDEVLPRVLDGKWDYAEGPKQMEAMMEELYAPDGILRLKDVKDRLKRFSTFEEKYPRMAKNFWLMKYNLNIAAGEHATAAAAGKAFVDDATARKNANDLSQIAFAIMNPKTTNEKRDYDLALRAAKEAVKLSEEKEPMILETLARTYAEKGEFEKAVEAMEKALKVSLERTKPEFTAALEKYKKKQK